MHMQGARTAVTPVHVVQPPGSNGHLTAVPGSPRSLLARLWRLKYLVLAVSLICTALTGYWFVLFPVQYSSSITIFMEGETDLAGDNGHGMLSRSLGVTRLTHLVTSTAMADHMVERFDLTAHYGLDPAHPQRLQQAGGWFVESVSIQLVDQLSLAITVSDPDKMMAAAMANELFVELKHILDTSAAADLERTIAFYQRIIDRTEVRSHEQATQLGDLLEQSNGTNGASGLDARTDLELAEIVAKLSANHEGLLQARNTFEVSAAMLKEKPRSTLHLMRKATEDIETSAGLKIATSMILALFISAALMIGGVVIWHRHGHEFLEYVRS